MSKRALWPFQVHLNKENFGKFNKAYLASSHFFASESENSRKAKIKGIEKKIKSHAVGMAVARPYGFKIDFVRNSISGSAARFRYYPQIHFYTHL